MPDFVYCQHTRPGTSIGCTRHRGHGGDHAGYSSIAGCIIHWPNARCLAANMRRQPDGTWKAWTAVAAQSEAE